MVGDKKKWVPCSVCGLDVTWPYVLHSDASRAIVAHNCRYSALIIGLTLSCVVACFN